MKTKSVLLFIFILKTIEGRIKIDVTSNNTESVLVNYVGYEKNVVSDKEIELFQIDERNLKKALADHYKTRPSAVYLKRPTPWGDLYKTYNWEQVSTILTVKSAKIKSNTIKSTAILSQEFSNPSSVDIKVNAGITQTVENTITSSWSKGRELEISQEFEYDLNVLFAKISGTTGISMTKSWGKSEEKSESVTIGTSSSVEIELKPGQNVTAVLTAKKYILELDITYSLRLRGNVAVNFNKKYNGHHFYGPSIDSVLKWGKKPTEVTRTETIRVGLFTDSTLKVYDNITRLPL